MLVYLRLNLFKYQITTTTVLFRITFISANFQKFPRDTNHWIKQILSAVTYYLSDKLSHLKQSGKWEQKKVSAQSISDTEVE